MRNAAVAVALTMLAAAPTGAGAAAPTSPAPPDGVRCVGLWLSDPTVADPEDGALAGGPLAAADGSADVSMRCSVQVGTGNDRHSGADAVSVASAASPGVTAIPPTRAPYELPWQADAYLCTEATVAGVTYHWDADDGTWSTSDAVACGVLPPFAAAVELLVWYLLYDGCDVDLCPPYWVSELLCPFTWEFAGRYPGVEVEPDGDVTVLGHSRVECRPYD